MNINALRDQDATQPHFYVAGSGTQTGWPGALVFQSKDAGVSYQKVATLDFPAVIGVCQTALGNWTGNWETVDTVNTVKVLLYYGTLSSVTFDQFLAGINMAVINGEIVFFQNAVLQGDGSYILSNFLRARRGSDFFIASHNIGDRFVLADPRALQMVPMSAADIGVPNSYKGVTAGDSVDNVSAVQFTYDGANLKPYSPVDATGVRDGSGNLTIGWTRREKTAGDVLLASTMTPMSEVSEAYEIDIFDSTFTTYKRTLTTSAPSVAYSAADQTTDFGSAQNPVYCKVYQMSAVVGRGYPMTATV